MRFSAPLTSMLLLTGASAAENGTLNEYGALAPASDRPTCVQVQPGPGLRLGWTVRIPNAGSPENIRNICGKMWAGLKQFAACIVSSPHGCGAWSENSTTVDWTFHTSVWCAFGMVEAAYWEGTHNEQGELRCRLG